MPRKRLLVPCVMISILVIMLYEIHFEIGQLFSSVLSIGIVVGFIILAMRDKWKK